MPASAAQATGTVDLTVQRVAMNFSGMGAGDASNSFNGELNMIVCEAGSNPSPPKPSGWSINGGTPIPRGMKGQSQTLLTKGCKVFDAWTQPGQAGMTGVEAQALSMSIPASDILLEPLGANSTVQLAAWLRQRGTELQATPQGFESAWWVARISAVQTLTITSVPAAKPPAGTPSAQPGDAGGSTPGAGAGTDDAGALATATISLTAPASIKRGKGLKVAAVIAPVATGKVRLTLTRKSPVGKVVTVKTATVKLKNGTAKATLKVPKKAPRGSYTLTATFVPSAAGTGAVSASKVITVR